MSGAIHPSAGVEAGVVTPVETQAVGVHVAEHDAVRRFATLTFMRGSFIAIAVTLAAGLLGALYMIPAVAPFMQSLGLDLRQLRPIHTTFAGAWIFLGGAAVVYRFLQELGGPITAGDRWRLRVQVLAWALAGAGILATLLFRVTSGREYVGFHPAFSALILVGWLCYLWNFFRVVGRSFWQQPIYVTMWGVAFFLFLYTFGEQHAYLLPGIFADPIHDLRIQWKATGVLVGSFNLFVYGTIYFIAERISGDTQYCYSKTAYALFAVGLLNSFTNFGHHTYHLPQSAAVNWISFVVSMTEIIILARAMQEIWCAIRDKVRRPFSAALASFTAAKWWIVAILFTSVIISIPPINAVIHGTYVVTGHAMGATIGIDSMILLGALFWILSEFMSRAGGGQRARTVNSQQMRRLLIGLNVSVAALVVWLHVAGLVTGVTRMGFAPSEIYNPPAWLGASNGIVFTVTGAAAIVFFTLILRIVMPASFRATERF